jgi:hypothetical protein
MNSVLGSLGFWDTELNSYLNECYILVGGSKHSTIVYYISTLNNKMLENKTILPMEDLEPVAEAWSSRGRGAI